MFITHFMWYVIKIKHGCDATNRQNEFVSVWTSSFRHVIRCTGAREGRDVFHSRCWKNALLGSELKPDARRSNPGFCAKIDAVYDYPPHNMVSKWQCKSGSGERDGSWFLVGRGPGTNWAGRPSGPAILSWVYEQRSSGDKSVRTRPGTGFHYRLRVYRIKTVQTNS